MHWGCDSCCDILNPDRVDPICEESVTDTHQLITGGVLSIGRP